MTAPTNQFDRRYATFGVMGTNVYTASGEQFRTSAQGRAIVAGLRFTLDHRGGERRNN